MKMRKLLWSLRIWKLERKDIFFWLIGNKLYPVLRKVFLLLNLNFIGLFIVRFRNFCVKNFLWVSRSIFALLIKITVWYGNCEIAEIACVYDLFKCIVSNVYNLKIILIFHCESLLNIKWLSCHFVWCWWQLWKYNLTDLWLESERNWE